MSRDNNPAPHACGDCGEPAYHGFNVPGKCIQFGCTFYDVGLWADWTMWLPDVEDPVSDFEDEDTNPAFTVPGITAGRGFGTPLLIDPDGTTTNRYLDAVGQLFGVAGHRDESDHDYRNRLTDVYRKAP